MLRLLRRRQHAARVRTLMAAAGRLVERGALRLAELRFRVTAFVS